MGGVTRTEECRGGFGGDLDASINWGSFEAKFCFPDSSAALCSLVRIRGEVSREPDRDGDWMVELDMRLCTFAFWFFVGVISVDVSSLEKVCIGIGDVGRVIFTGRPVEDPFKSGDTASTEGEGSWILTPSVIPEGIVVSLVPHSEVDRPGITTGSMVGSGISIFFVSPDASNPERVTRTCSRSSKKHGVAVGEGLCTSRTGCCMSGVSTTGSAAGNGSGAGLGEVDVGLGPSLFDRFDI